MHATDRIDAETYHRDIVPGLLAGTRGTLAAAGLAGLDPLTLVVGDAAWTYRADDGRLRVEPADGESGARDTGTGTAASPDAGKGSVCVLSPDAWTDFVTQLRTAAALAIAGDVEVRRGTVLDLFAWEPALRALYQGIPIYRSTGPTVTDGAGRPVDLERAWTLGDTDADLAAFFEATGVMRVRGVFTAEEIAAFNAEVDRLADLARTDDGRSWWAAAEDGTDILCRMVYANDHSPLIAGLARDPRLLRLSGLLHPDLAACTDRMEGISVLLKPPGRLKGLANIPWHTDCGLGGHQLRCPAVAVGIQLTGSSPENGCLEAIAGTHGKTCPAPEKDDLAGLPHMSVPTDPGDVTVHIADVLHASPPPTGTGGRRTMYVTFYPPSLFETVGKGLAANDLIRSRSASELDASLGR
ncbi:phytanoyl-CoA dioxygenase family protein [Yinghuangia soli]|uniref:Phytanoyl-CoA dioxygenase family protein n=1 Tax=Yinghuangia soli TaxID=2908204 RepID=A0AA41Q0Y1_9ACTN|nr:phytanoyl-CoA dioxygenase family protein [Yinghuangia soli]MCF2528027.1 phytanoyl-CoA dioxygenase family protein [Yinghuangia soli]